MQERVFDEVRNEGLTADAARTKVEIELTKKRRQSPKPEYEQIVLKFKRDDREMLRQELERAATERFGHAILLVFDADKPDDFKHQLAKVSQELLGQKVHFDDGPDNR